MALKDLLIICGGEFLIINWIRGLDRCFSGLQKSLTSIRSLKGDRKYYDYRRTALPYIIWIADNLKFVGLSELCKRLCRLCFGVFGWFQPRTQLHPFA